MLNPFIQLPLLVNQFLIIGHLNNIFCLYLIPNVFSIDSRKMWIESFSSLVEYQLKTSLIISNFLKLVTNYLMFVVQLILFYGNQMGNICRLCKLPKHNINSEFLFNIVHQYCYKYMFQCIHYSIPLLVEGFVNTNTFIRF